MILRFLLLLFYWLLKGLVLFYQAFYFPFTVFRGREHLRFKGPGIIVSNHPNTMVDPLNVISRTPRQSFFLANASMFKNPIAGFILRYLYCIPIRRPGKDEGVKKVDNQKSFDATFEHLEGGGVIYIAPEGGSEMERRLRPLKTGTARIALGVEARNNFQLGLCIHPAGLTYEQPTYCGSRLYMEASEPIRVADWQEAYEKDSVKAARELTDYLADRMRQLLVHTDNDEQDQLLYRLERIFQHDEPLPIDQHYDRIQQLLSGLKSLAKDQPSSYQQLQEKAASYRLALRENNVTDRGISQQDKGLFTAISLLAWPIWLYGRLNNIFVYEIPRWLERKMDLYIGYRTTVKVISSLIIFPLFYFLQYKLVGAFTDTRTALWYLLSLPISGVLAWGYAYHVQPRLEAWQWRKWAKGNAETAHQLQKQRAGLKKEALVLINN